MSRYLAWCFLAVVMLVVSAPLQAVTYEVGGCKTGKSYVNFTTISAAVAGVPEGSTIEVCPGVYPEQVTITQPLTLKGIGFNNANRCVITINLNGSLAPNVTSFTGLQFYAQVLVQNVSPAGAVNIIGITVDGSGANARCSSLTLAGIFYASSTSGTVNEVTARNQVNSGCGYGIWVENGSSTNEVITIENSSVHNAGSNDGGIAAFSVNPPTLVANINGNFLSNAGFLAIEHSTTGEISQNLVTPDDSAGIGILAVNDPYIAFGNENPDVVDSNTVADTLGKAIEVHVDGIDVTSNKLSNVGTGILIVADPTYTVGPAALSNAIKNTLCAIDLDGGLYFGTGGNTINDSLYGYANSFGFFPGNAFYNTDNVTSNSTSCP